MCCTAKYSLRSKAPAAAVQHAVVLLLKDACAITDSDADAWLYTGEVMGAALKVE